MYKIFIRHLEPAECNNVLDSSYFS